MARRAALGAVAVLLTLAGLVSVRALEPPAVRPADAPAGEFSAERALTHVRQIAVKPHPTGSAESERVREYIARTARAFGAMVETQSGPAASGEGKELQLATVHNVVARFPGTGPAVGTRRSVLVVAHYDSVPGGPGAADDGAAVGSMLESMRAISESGPVRNDIVFLFTDGEELGSLGARLFVERNEMAEFGVVLNWEARGSSGPVLTFETSTGNAALMSGFAAAVSRPTGNSLAYEIYRRMSNDSDFTVFKEAGATGINSAFIDGFHDYHAASDSVDNLSGRSVQHQGDTMLGLVRSLGDREAPVTSGGDTVYFDLFSRLLVHYPAGWALPAAALSVLAMGGLLWLGVRRGTVRPRGLLLSAAGGLGAVLASAALCAAGWLAIAALRPDFASMPLSEPYAAGGFALALLLLVPAVAFFAARLLRRLNTAELAGGGLLLSALLLAGTAAVLPGATYLTQWPLAAGLPVLWWLVRRPRSWEARTVLLGAAPAVVAVALSAPLVKLLVIALGVASIAVPALLTALSVILLLPLLARLPRTRTLAAGTTVLALGLVAAVMPQSTVGPQRPRTSTLVYVRDMAAGSSYWLSPDARDPWVAKALGEQPRPVPVAGLYPGRGDRPMLRGEAPAVAVPAPTVRVLSDATEGDVRRLRVRVTSAREAWQLRVRLPEGACRTAGRAVTELRLTGAAEGLVLECRIAAGKQITVDAADFSIGFGAEVAELVGPRPENSVQAPFGFAPYDSVIARNIATL
ncbi:M20/M25/M40 family metallo-hydrolase [Streptomyces canus]|uniref:M20/M25/M40 family metallo-hydrolase n=1 Tax=Streptomyces canus TaxID=58343 RepID=UPI003676DB9C